MGDAQIPPSRAGNALPAPSDVAAAKSAPANERPVDQQRDDRPDDRPEQTGRAERRVARLDERA